MVALIHPMGIVLPDGTALRRWQTWEVNSDCQKLPTSSWRATFGPAASAEVREIKAMLAGNPVVGIELCGTPQVTGRVQELDSYTSRGNGSILNVAGTDTMAATVKSSLDLGFQAHGAQSVKDLIAAAVARWGVVVVGDDSADRAVRMTRRRVSPGLHGDEGALDAEGDVQYTEQDLAAEQTGEVETKESRDLHAKPGEKVIPWIKRLLAAHNLCAWVQSDGRLWIGRPNYEQPVSLVLVRAAAGGTPTEGTIIEGGCTRTPGDQLTSVRIVGRVGRHGETHLDATVTDPAAIAAGWDTPSIEEVRDVTKQAEALNRAKKALAESQIECWRYVATMAGIGVGPRMPTYGCMVGVEDDDEDVHRDVFVMQRQVKATRDDAVQSVLTCILPGLWGVE
jgi:prophage tail gpP-like protein